MIHNKLHSFLVENFAKNYTPRTNHDKLNPTGSISSPSSSSSSFFFLFIKPNRATSDQVAASSITCFWHDEQLPVLPEPAGLEQFNMKDH